jgi:hypothetical protein
MRPPGVDSEGVDRIAARLQRALLLHPYHRHSPSTCTRCVCQTASHRACSSPPAHSPRLSPFPGLIGNHYHEICAPSRALLPDLSLHPSQDHGWGRRCLDTEFTQHLTESTLPSTISAAPRTIVRIAESVIPWDLPSSQPSKVWRTLACNAKLVQDLIVAPVEPITRPPILEGGLTRFHQGTVQGSFNHRVVGLSLKIAPLTLCFPTCITTAGQLLESQPHLRDCGRLRCGSPSDRTLARGSCNDRGNLRWPVLLAATHASDISTSEPRPSYRAGLSPKPKQR